MALVLEWATLGVLCGILGVLCFNAHRLNAIRNISRACYAELNCTRWEKGARLSVVAQEQQESPAPLRRQA
jgi:hypothetical protein